MMANARVLEANCHCGRVTVAILHKPSFIQDCNCSLCRKSGGVWGYFAPAEVKVLGATSAYTRNDYAQPAVEIHFCSVCGSTTHWVLSDYHVVETGLNDKMGVNMRLFRSDELVGVELRFPDGENWDGVSEYQFRKPSVVLTKSASL